MSFPSAVVRIAGGDTAEAALLFAFKHDTPLGFAAIKAVVDVAKIKGALECCPGCSVKKLLGTQQQDDFLRCEEIGQGIAADFDPLSETGMQIARLLGTDVARPLIEGELGMTLGFANCCKVIASTDKADTLITPLQQVQWQTSIDC